MIFNFTLESEKSSETTESLTFNSKIWKSVGNTKDIEKILGTTNEVDSDPGTQYFLVKMKDGDNPGLLRAEVAKEKIPQLVIRFYESVLKWTEDED